MFVSVVLDPGGQDSARQMAEILATFGFEKVQRACWESKTLNDQILAQLKQELDRVTDYYDSARIYQYPVDGVMAITVLSKKTWKRIVVRPPAGAGPQAPNKPRQ